MEPLISISNLLFAYNETFVLKNIDLEIYRGETCFILGPNGSGKTTLIHCINGLLTPQKGTVRIGKSDIQSLTLRQRACFIALVAQESQATFPYNVIDMVVMGRTPHLNFLDKPDAADYDMAWHILENIGIQKLARRPYTRLSGGEKQMVRLARALAQDSTILLLDEPTAHLDIKNAYTIMDTIQVIAQERGLTVVATVHDPNIALRYARRVIMIERGKIFTSGPIDQVMTSENLTRLYQMPLDTTTIGDTIFIIYQNVRR
ncbi:ABC transporter ATP-binding protein [candidate division CSSED10-310 bacterium]|uniref:ABC transporter ATP-binding protein n=1 Tax=candidate division CSSED10-310 bacterium TaxID=2855610 RepID=A0ABV6YXZ6_UNCC1